MAGGIRLAAHFRSTVNGGTLAQRVNDQGGYMELEPTELSDAIKAVRDGLAAAQRDGAGSPIRFTVKDVVLDLGIELRHTASAGGGVKAFVVSADAKGERSKTATHRITVTLSVAPDAEGNDLEIGDTAGGRGGSLAGLGLD
ncbi:trypco2 family protein [Streptomyces sp. NPDC089922]|uniref:trypco2 family protein n=1 Tax=unclassified Streptomyces TaxID=2593676 RepID=UPI00341A80D7